MLRYLLAALALVAPGVAHAEWFEASSANFVVYANDSEKDVRRFTERLELYHQAMELLTGVDVAEPSPSNRVTVYVVRNTREVQKLYGENSRYVGGFYVPRAGGSVAFVPQVEGGGSGQLDYSMIALLHEYAHHFLISNSKTSAPRWFGEGGAEFFASAEFPSAGGIKIGMPANHRAGELAFARDVTVEQLLDPAAYEEGARKGFDSFYGKSWALYHYLSLGAEARKDQLGRYLTLLGQGKGSREAGLEAFGDFKQLDREIDKYLRQRTMLAVVFSADKLHIGAIAVRSLTAGEAAIMPVRFRSDRGVTREEAVELLVDARAVAAKYPGEAMVQTALAEAEFDAGHDAEAIAAADAALALDPKQANAYVQKGYALFHQAAEADDTAAAYKKAIAPFLALNKIENDHPLPLVYYFRSFAERGVEPSKQAVLGLERATELAPFDFGLRLNLAIYQINAGDLAQARGNLLPLAYNPHGGEMAEAARRVVERIDAGGEPPAAELLALLDSSSGDNAGAGSDEGAGGAD